MHSSPNRVAPNESDSGLNSAADNNADSTNGVVNSSVDAVAISTTIDQVRTDIPDK